MKYQVFNQNPFLSYARVILYMYVFFPCTGNWDERKRVILAQIFSTSGGQNDKITRIGQVALRATALSARLSRIILLPQV